MYGNQMLYQQAVTFQANTQVKLILIDQIRYIDIDKGKNKERLEQRQNFRMLTLETLTPEGTNQELN